MFSQATLPKEIDLQLQCFLYSDLHRSRTGRSHASSLRVACVTPARAAARGRLAVQLTFKWSKNTSKLQNTVISSTVAHKGHKNPAIYFGKFGW